MVTIAGPGCALTDGLEVTLDGCYVYCIVPSSDGAYLGVLGLDGAPVYVAGEGAVGAVVHDCRAAPYQSADANVCRDWVLAHHRVVEAAWRRWGTVLPLAFNTIIQAEDKEPAVQRLDRWLDGEHDALAAQLKALYGKAEYGVQVSADASKLAAQTITPRAVVEATGRAQSPGLAFLQQRRTERLGRRETYSHLASLAGVICQRIARCADAVRVERKHETVDNRIAVLNATCLLSAEQYGKFAAALDQIATANDLEVIITGPMPPYSFCTTAGG